MALNTTHDPARLSWVESANAMGSDYPLQNLPVGVFRRHGSSEAWRCGVAIGDQVLDLATVQALGLAEGLAAAGLAACADTALNRYMALGGAAWSALRAFLSNALDAKSPQCAAWHTRLQAALIPQGGCEYGLPARIGDYTDFYASIYHATAVGRLFRPDNPLLPNYQWVPIGYHGRTSSIGVAAQEFVRPVGQIKPADATAPTLAASSRLDYELEIGMFIGAGNALGSRIDIADAEHHVFGLCLLNDWSARDIQAWEYQPLGPFLSKNFATTISPWIVSLEALEPFRTPWTRSADHPQPLAYLDCAELRARGGIDLRFEATLSSAAMRARGLAPLRLSRSSFRHSYWSVSQMVAHHTVNGCNLQAGDLLGSGTQSGPTPEEAGSLLELTVGGKQPLQLPSGESRRFLEDGDSVCFSGWCERDGFRRLGFGSVSGTVLPARCDKRDRI